jgi:hypothetical protein
MYIRKTICIYVKCIKLKIYLYSTYNPENILFIRTPTTGEWLDKLFIKNVNVSRILYKRIQLINLKIIHQQQL